MTATRALTLKKETLSELTAEDLHGVVGGAPSGTTCPIGACLKSYDNCLLPTNEGCTPNVAG